MRVSRLLIVWPMLLTAGCFQGGRVIKLNVDGSGTIVDTVKLNDAGMSMLAGFEKTDTATPAEKKARRVAVLKEEAAKMGEAVTLVSFDTASDGTEKTIYAFKDVSKIKVSSGPHHPEVDRPDKESSEDPFTFRFSRNGASSVLTAVRGKTRPNPAAKKPDESDAQKVALLRSLMAGFKMTFAVEVSGKLVKSSSPHAAGSVVTLMEVDLDQVDEAGFRKLGADAWDAQAFKGVKGVKLPERETVIEFAAR
jgi:hypothetical protein